MKFRGIKRTCTDFQIYYHPGREKCPKLRKEARKQIKFILRRTLTGRERGTLLASITGAEIGSKEK